MFAAQTGTRLAYVVRPLEGTVEREIVVFDKKNGEGLVRKMRKVPAGNMVYFPRGHVLRLTDAQLKFYKLDRKPRMINIQGLNDPNSPIGKMINAQDEEERHGAYLDLEKSVMQLATAMTGSVLMPEQLKAVA
jgi:hypothetical protein